MITLFLLFVCSLEFKVSGIEITGNEYCATPALRTLMLTNTPALFRSGTFNSDIFKGDVAALKSYYNSYGFVDVVIEHQLVFDTTSQTVRINIHIVEGTQTFVDSILVKGNTLFTNDFLLGNLNLSPGGSFDKRKLDADNYLLTALYDDRGYANAVVTSDYVRTGSKATITHTISEGEQQYVDTIEFVGLKRTRRRIALNETQLTTGDVFRYATILQGQRNLYNLGVFTSVRIQTENAKQENRKVVRYIVVEKDPIRLTARIGYGTQDYARCGFGVTHVNMFGRAWLGKIEGKVSFAEYRGGATVTVPRIVFLPVRSTFDAFYQYKKELSYRTRIAGASYTGYFDLFAGKVSARYNVETVRTYPDNDTVTSDWLQGITVSWLLDRRNDPLMTRQGYSVNLTQELSGVIMPSDVNYVRPTMEVRVFKPRNVFVGGISLRLGMVQPVAPSDDVPVYKRFYCGGATSVRGYSEWSIGPHDENGNPLGGRYLIESSGEVRFPLYRILGGVLFIDAGNVWQERDELSINLRWGTGAGLRLQTPLGSVRLDYGIKLGRQDGESFGALHFAIGEAF
jgi:outer membrane protein assembly complex protein YaeT